MDNKLIINNSSMVTNCDKTDNQVYEKSTFDKLKITSQSIVFSLYNYNTTNTHTKSVINTLEQLLLSSQLA